ncbi:MAG: helix-turn-helix transcriptional regulator [Christensenella sp.]
MNYYDIGKRIRNKRKQLGMSQEKLSEMVEISVTHMSHIETGNTKLSLPVLVKIANALGASTDELLCDTLVSSKNIYNNEIANVLEHCDDTQTRIITDIIKTAKQSLDKNHKGR